MNNVWYQMISLVMLFTLFVEHTLHGLEIYI